MREGQNGELRLRTEACGETVRLTIEDTGPGVPPEMLERMWEPFFTTKAPGQGTGLGLSISRGIIEAHGGLLEAANTGGGLCFTITLPALAAAAPGS
jgi:signal transduction histidine kinase